MSKKYIRNILAVFIFVCMMLPMASLLVGAASYEYYFPIYVTDNTSSDRVYVPFMTGSTGQSFIDGGYIDNDALDTRYRYGSTDLKYMIADGHITGVLPSLPSNGMVTTKLYTGYDPKKTGFEIVPGPGGYITQADNWSLELTRPTLEFDGAADYANLGDNATIQNMFDGGGTLNVWINPDNVGGGNFGRIIAKANPAAGTNGWQLYFAEPGADSCKIIFLQYYTGNDAQSISNTTDIPFDEWSLITVTFDSSTTDAPTIYRNGQSMTQTQTDGTGTRETDAGLTLWLGRWNTNLARNYDGSMKTVNFFNTEFTAAEVLAYYTDFTSGSPTHEWRLNEGTGTVLADSVGTQNGQAISTTWNTNPGWQVYTNAYVDTDNGTEKYLITKGTGNVTDPFNLVVSDTISGNISARIKSSTNSTTANYTGSPDGFTRPGNTFWRAQTFHMPYDSDVPYYQIHSVALYVDDNTSNLALRAWLRGATYGVPTGANISYGATNLDNSNTLHWYWITVSDVVVATNASLSLVFQIEGPPFSDVYYDNTSPAATDGNGAFSSDTGATWTANTTLDFFYAVNATPIYQVSKTGEISGEHEIVTGSSSPFLSLGVDHGSTPITPVSDNLVANIPFWQTELQGDAFDSIDSIVHNITTTDTTWDEDGRVFDITHSDTAIITVPDSARFDPVQDRSVSVWIKLSSLNATDKVFFIKDSATRLRVNSAAEGSVFAGFVYDSGAASWEPRVTSTVTPVPGVWNQVTMTYDGTTLSIYIDGAFDASTATGIVTAANANNVNIGCVSAGVSPIDGIIGEVQFYDYCLTSDEVEQNYEATKWKYLGTGDISTISTLAIVPDNSSNWTYQYMGGAENDWMPYADNFTVGVTDSSEAGEVTQFEPNTMILNTVLPNRKLSGDPGIIHWGDNNNEVIISYGAMVSFEGTTSTGNTTTTEVAPNVPIPFNWFGLSGNVSALPFYDRVHEIAASMDYPDTDEGVRSIYFIIFWGIALMLFIGVAVFTRSALMAFIAMEAPLIMGTASVVPGWIPFAVAAVGFAIMYLYGRVSA